MIDWIPLAQYTPIYYYMMMLVVFLTLLQTQSLAIDDNKNISYTQRAGHFILLFTLIYMGFRPISGRYFVDMSTYANIFENYAQGAPITQISN